MYLVAFNANVGLAVSENDFDKYMLEWDQKREMASQYLIQAETALREGDELTSCSIQKKASKYGIEATLSLIKAFEISGKEQEIVDLESGLNKWRELGDFC